MTKATNTLTDAQIRIAVETLIAEGGPIVMLNWSALRMALERRKAAAERELAAIGELPRNLPLPPPRAMPAPGEQPRASRGSRAQTVISFKPAQLSPVQARSRKLQGAYLSLIRQIPAADRGAYQAMVRNDPKHGRRDAIAAMQAAIGGGGKAPKRRRGRPRK